MQARDAGSPTASALAPKPDPDPGSAPRDRLMVSGQDIGSLILPVGYRGAEAFDIAGRLVFRKALDASGSGRAVRIRGLVEKGRLRIKYMR